jgi:NAD(P)-dependent dehydrogenase (short-subunit alcohol dehydrogenase family)
VPVAVVTGASRGIGRAIAVALANAGHDVVAVARDGGELEALGSEVRGIGREFLTLAADLSTADGPARATEEAWRWRGEIHALVNAAGMLVRKPEAEVTTAEWDRVMALNVRAPFVLMERLGRRMAAAGQGSIVNVGSIAAEVVTRAPAPYQASKAALVQLTRYYAVNLAPNVRVNAVGPGYIETDLTRAWLSDPANAEYVRLKTPLERVGFPENVAAAVVFLSSDGANYITGQHLLIDGGWTAT